MRVFTSLHLRLLFNFTTEEGRRQSSIEISGPSRNSLERDSIFYSSRFCVGLGQAAVNVILVTP